MAQDQNSKTFIEVVAILVAVFAVIAVFFLYFFWSQHPVNFLTTYSRMLIDADICYPNSQCDTREIHKLREDIQKQMN